MKLTPSEILAALGYDRATSTGRTQLLSAISTFAVVGNSQRNPELAAYCQGELEAIRELAKAAIANAYKPR
jgi:hypothetical protein